MCVKSDEQILYECYLKLSVEAETKAMKKNNVSAKNDKKLIEGINSKLSLLLVYLDETNMLTTAEIVKKLISAKGMYMQFFQVKGRNPKCVMGSMNDKMDRLIRAVARHEANILQSVRNQEVGGERIDLETVFEKKGNLNRLGNTIARDVVRDAMKDLSMSVGKSKVVYYITETGKKYHTDNCPYCRGRELIPATRAIVENQKLTACKCIALKKVADEADMNCVTAFIDESIHPIKWNEEGTKGSAGSYSYIICRGHLASENDIENTVVIAQGIDYMKEKDHIEHLTEAAIGKVMMILAYDYNFKGNVQIFTDNITAMEKWNTISTNSRLAKLFESVTVSFVPREKNTHADKLGRTQMFMSIPTATYNEIVTKVCAYDNIQKQKAEAKRREAEFKAEQARIAKEQAEQRRMKEQRMQEMSLWDRIVSALKAFFKVKEPIPVKVETRSELN